MMFWMACAILSSTGVPRVDWEGASTLEYLVRSGVPAVVVGSPATSWPALQRWTPQRLEALAPTLRNVYASTQSSNFVYAAAVGGEEDAPVTYSLANLSAREFFAAAAHGQRWVYYSAPLAEMFGDAADSARADVTGPSGGPEQLAVLFGRRRSSAGNCDLDAVSNASGASSEWCVRSAGAVDARYVRAAAVRDDIENIMWIGAPGVTTNAHFDTVHNFFVQLRGLKRFRLIAPTPHAIGALRLHSKLHTSRRQSQVDVGDEAVVRSLARGGSAVEDVELAPGEVLYIPPFHFHHVRALGAAPASPPAVSLSVWSSAEPEHAAIDAAEAIAVPFEAEWERPRRRSAAAAFVWRILAQLHAERAAPAARIVVAELLLPRYAGLAASRGCAAAVTAAVCTVADRALSTKVQQRADRVAAAFARVPTRARLLYLLDYVEVVAAWAEDRKDGDALRCFFAAVLRACGGTRRGSDRSNGEL